MNKNRMRKQKKRTSYNRQTEKTYFIQSPTSREKFPNSQSHFTNNYEMRYS